MKVAAITMDFDFPESLQGKDEVELFWPCFEQLIQQVPELKTTWYIRLDEKVQSSFGSADHYFGKHHNKISWLQQNGHETGWHFHAWDMSGGKAKQEIREAEVCRAMRDVKPYLQRWNLQHLRMGWGYHSNQTMALAAELGMKTDASALPKPAYAGEKSTRNWEFTGDLVYKPSVADYRITGTPELDITEIPATCMRLPLPSDKEPNMMRVADLSWNTAWFETLIASERKLIHTISHPAALFGTIASSTLNRHSIDNWIHNLNALQQAGYRFATIPELAMTTQ